MIDITCFGDDVCENGRFIIITASENDMISKNNVSNVYFDCNGSQSCHDGIITVIGIDDFELNCNGMEACLGLVVTSKSINSPHGAFKLACNGNLSCEKIAVDAVSMNSVNIICGDGYLPCYDMQVN